MTEFILLSGVLFFGTIAVIQGIILFEAWRPESFRMIRRWRYAHSKRKEIGDALRSARDAHARERTSASEAAAANGRSKATQAQCERRENDAVAQAQNAIADMGSYIIAEQSSEHIKGIRANNFDAKKKKIVIAIKKAAQHGYDLPGDEVKQLNRMLKNAHVDAKAHEKAKQEQAEIRAAIREEDKRNREFERAIKQAEKDERTKRKALEDAIKLLGDTHSDQLDQLKAELAEAHAAMERTKSMAEQTKAGHVYVISNGGSFGFDVFKVGMTRRLEPMDRVKELGDASVPFSFDVHAMISSDDAPALESALHRELNQCRVNTVNLRKEFFRTDIDTIVGAVKKNHGTVEYVADAEALEYFQSKAEHESVDSDSLV